MNKKLIIISSTLTILGLALSCRSDAAGRSPEVEMQSAIPSDSIAADTAPETNIPVIDPKKQALIDAYPDFISEVKENLVVFTDGSTMEFDDRKEKDFPTRLDNCDIEDMFSIRYCLPDPEPDYLADAGRMRSDALFKKMYGNNAGKVQSTLTTVDWFGQKVKFTAINGAADSLKAVAKEIAQFPELKPYLKSSGTFYWRPVRGANRMSAHSYGIAFDIAVDKSDYWLWKSKNNNELAKVKYANRIPLKLVEIFQRHGFIWGGAWYHFDTMHFEFRPEILRYAELTQP